MTVKTELKLKAKIEDVAEVSRRIKKIAKRVGVENATDFFYENESGAINEFRIRKAGKENEVVLKVPVYSDDFQKNEEYKFKISDAEDLARFVERFGFKLAAIVKKKSEVYEKETIGIRISDVERIGKFVELTAECNCKESGSEEEKKKEEMLNLLKEILGEDAENAVDNRYYGALIKQMDEGK